MLGNAGLILDQQHWTNLMLNADAIADVVDCFFQAFRRLT
jgi:hypothetical protein